MKRLRNHLRKRRHGVALLEIVLATTVFVITAMFVLTGLHSSMRAVDRARLEAEAEDHAVTQLSRIQMGAYDIVNTPPTPIDEELFPGWTYEFVVTPMADMVDWPTLLRVEVIVRHEELDVVHRVWQLVLDEFEREEEEL